MSFKDSEAKFLKQQMSWLSRTKKNLKGTKRSKINF